MTPSTTAYVGTYDEDGNSTDLYSFRVDHADGTFEHLDTASVGQDPFYQTIHPTKNVLYSVNFSNSGIIRAFSISEETGSLTELNQESTGDAGPCYISVASTGDSLVVANYKGGSVSMLPIANDGRLDPMVDHVKHDGSSVDPDRQSGPFPHCIRFGSNDQFAYAADLGTDEVLTYAVDHENGKLQEIDSIAMTPGAGPRHIAFHPRGTLAFVINELDSTITVFRRTPDTGELEPLSTTSTLPEDYAGENYAADIHVHPSGEWVYGSNRGHNSIAIYALDENTGELTLVDREPARGEWPWNFSLTPDGSRLYVVNRDSHDILAFRIAEDDGTLAPIGEPASASNPVCLNLLDSE